MSKTEINMNKNYIDIELFFLNDKITKTLTKIKMRTEYTKTNSNYFKKL